MRCSRAHIVIFLAFLLGTQGYSSSPAVGTEVDLIIFTFDRPLQLYCLLEGIEKYVSNLSSLCVIGRASDAQFKRAYDEVAQRFPSVSYRWQGLEPKKDFKPLVMKRLQESCAEYVLFAVDDLVITDYIDVRECVHALETTNAYAFYLRLGMNITYSYIRDAHLTLPSFHNLDGTIMTFFFNESKSYWAYPNTVDMALYRKKEIIQVFADLTFHSPNTLEGRWSFKADPSVQGICFNHSKIVNIPLNIVQQDWINKSEQEYTPQELLKVWQEGFKIDIDHFYQIHTTSCHIPSEPIFIKRD